MKLFNFTIIKLTLCLILGILINHWFPINNNITIVATSVVFIILIILFFYLKLKIKNSYWFGILGFLMMILIGITANDLQNKNRFINHYTNHYSTNNLTNKIITFRVREILKSSNYYDKYIVDLLSIDSITVIGKTLLNIKKDSVIKNLSIDDIKCIYSKFAELNPPLNPHQFDYKKYLKKQQIYHQIIVSNSELFSVSNNKHTLLGFAAKLREYIQLKLREHNFGANEYAIINALLLGQRQDISKEIYDSYAKAGAIHILAVSGLHVGIVLFLLNFLLKPIELLRLGKYLKIITIVALLWSFAIIAGLSASVTRAVTMFTIIAIAMHLKRPTNIYNTLAISVFVLLLFKPSFLFDVGFQLSYLAVIAIVTVQPIIYKLYRPKYKVDTLFWNIFTVTLAAQLGVLPLSLYYFHQFPGLFFLSNLVIIPFLGAILIFGIFIIALAVLNILPQFLAKIFTWIISTMNSFVQWISSQEAFLFQDISFNLTQTLLSYLLIISIVFVIIKKSFKSLLVLLILVLITQGYLIYNSKIKQNNEFIIFHKSRNTIIGQKNNHTLTIHHNLNDSILSLDKTITNYKVGSYIKAMNFDTIKNIYNVNGKLVLVIDSLNVYKVHSFKPQIVLLRNSPKINLARMIDSLNPELIISDGSNYQNYQVRWKKTCELKKIPFHRTSEKGAYKYIY